MRDTIKSGSTDNDGLETLVDDEDEAIRMPPMQAAMYNAYRQSDIKNRIFT